MRVLHCIPTIWSGSGGPSRVLVEICRATRAASADAEIAIATTDYGLTESWMRQVRSRLPEDVQLNLFAQVGEHTTNFSLPMMRWCWANLRRYDVIHIHALLHPISTACAWMARRRHRPYIVRPLGCLSPYTFRWRRSLLKRWYYACIDSRTVDGAAYVHFTTEQESSKAARLDFKATPVVIPISYSDGVHAPVERRESDLVVFIGRLDPVKGLDMLVRAFVNVVSVRPSARLVIAGNGEEAYERELRRLIDDAGLSSCVELPGFVDGARKRALLDTASVVVLPSYQENFGVVLLEAMSVGAPVVVSREVDLWHDIEAAGAGIVADTTVAALGHALAEALGDEAKRDGMGRAGMELVRRQYAPEVVGEQLVALYARTIEEY